jgi:hypothetical protein
MKKVKFLSDYQGIQSRELFYQAGDEAELQDAGALELASRGVVELLDDLEPDEAWKLEKVEFDVVESSEVLEPLNLEELSMKDLRAIAKDLKLKRYSKLSKPALIKSIKKAQK